MIPFIEKNDREGHHFPPDFYAAGLRVSPAMVRCHPGNHRLCPFLHPAPEEDPRPRARTRSRRAYALEIAWRVSQDPEVVKGIAP